MRADRALYLDASQTRLVTETSPESAWFLVGKGHEIPAAEVKRLGLSQWSDGRVMQGAEPKPVPKPVAAPAPKAEPVAPAMQEPKAKAPPKPKA